MTKDAAQHRSWTFYEAVNLIMVHKSLPHSITVVHNMGQRLPAWHTRPFFLYSIHPEASYIIRGRERSCLTRENYIQIASRIWRKPDWPSASWIENSGWRLLKHWSNLRMNEYIGDRGASANDLVTNHSPDHGFWESLTPGGWHPIQSGKAANPIQKTTEQLEQMSNIASWLRVSYFLNTC